MEPIPKPKPVIPPTSPNMSRLIFGKLQLSFLISNLGIVLKFFLELTSSFFSQLKETKKLYLPVFKVSPFLTTDSRQLL